MVGLFSDFGAVRTDLTEMLRAGDCYRADKLLEDHIDDLLEKGNFSSSEADEHRKVQRQADAYSPDELGQILEKYGIKATATNNDLTKPFAFNLMFGTKIGPSGALTGFLRPETAQGLFVNFKRLLDYNNGRVPFAAAQIGLGFRNEIAPKNGLLRVREFTMAEIEHFVRRRRPSTAPSRRRRDSCPFRTASGPLRRVRESAVAAMA